VTVGTCTNEILSLRFSIGCVSKGIFFRVFEWPLGALFSICIVVVRASSFCDSLHPADNVRRNVAGMPRLFTWPAMRKMQYAEFGWVGNMQGTKDARRGFDA
jgi:hypothetical protein